MRRPKTYSANVFGRTIVVRAYSMQQIADWIGVSLYSLRPFISACDSTEVNVDLTVRWPKWMGDAWLPIEGQ